MAEELVGYKFRVGISHPGTVATMHVGHKILAILVEVGLEGDGAAGNKVVRLHQLTAVGVHHLRIVQMGQHAEEDVTRSQLNAQQGVVDMLGDTFECLSCLLCCLLLHGLPGIIEHHSQ